MIFRQNRIIMFILFGFALFTTSSISPGYAYWENTNTISTGSLQLGTWTYIPLPIGPDFTADLREYMDYQLSLYPNSDYQYIYSQTNMPSNTSMNINDIEVFGYTWSFWGKVKTQNYPTLGYPVLIDRSVDIYGNPIHDIAPTYSSTLLYPNYDYFTAYDANNLSTNNTYSLRLNYNTRMTSTTALGKVTNISFYAAIGLADPDDGAAIRDNQKLYVEVSTNGSNWTKIGGNPVIVQVTSKNEYFTHYSIDVPANLLGQDLYVRIRYNGRTLNFNGSPAFARIIIDELVITTS